MANSRNRSFPAIADRQNPIINPAYLSHSEFADRDIIGETIEGQEIRSFLSRARCLIVLIFFVNLIVAIAGCLCVVRLPCDELGFVWNGDACNSSSKSWMSSGRRGVNGTFVDIKAHLSICLPCDRVARAAGSMWRDGGAVDGDGGKVLEGQCCKRLNKMVCTHDRAKAPDGHLPCPNTHDIESVHFALNSTVKSIATDDTRVLGWLSDSPNEDLVAYNTVDASFTVVSDGSYVIFSSLAFGCNPSSTSSIEHQIRVRSKGAPSAAVAVAVDRVDRDRTERRESSKEGACYDSRLMVSLELRGGDVLFVTAHPLSGIMRTNDHSSIWILRTA